MAARGLFLLGLLVAGAFATCTAPSDISLLFETWVPETPYVGEASYMVVNGTNNQASSFTITHCTVELTQGSYSYGSQGYIPCWTDEVKPGATFRFQTDVIWVPADAPLGTYTWALTAYDQFGNEIGCWSGSADVEEDPNPTPRAISCTNDGTITLGTETWVPVTPYRGLASYMVMNGQNKRSTPITVRYAKVTLAQVSGNATYSTPGAIDAYSGPVAPGAGMRFQTGSIWIPANLPTGKYNSYFTALDLNMNVLGCFIGNVTIKKAPKEEKTCSPGIFTAHTETWVPVKPQRGNASYVVVSGTNTAQYTANSFNCTVTLTQGTYSYGSNGRIACWTGPVAAGAAFRVQTDAIWVPTDAPLGQYATEIQAYGLDGTFVGCYTGTATVVKAPKAKDS